MTEIIKMGSALVVGIAFGAVIVGMNTEKNLGGVTQENETFKYDVTSEGTITAVDVVTTDDVTVGDDLTISGDVTVVGTLVGDDMVTTPVTATTTITASQSGTTFVIGTNGAIYTLPAVTNDGFYARFVVGSAFASTDAIVKSAEGDNMSGTLVVAGALVDCRAEDFINFIIDGEAIGDFVEVYSDGTQWLIGDSGALTGSKLTCTDPS